METLIDLFYILVGYSLLLRALEVVVSLLTRVPLAPYFRGTDYEKIARGSNVDGNGFNVH